MSQLIKSKGIHERYSNNSESDFEYEKLNFDSCTRLGRSLS